MTEKRVDEAWFKVVWPETIREVRVPRDVREELMIPVPRVVEVRTSVLAIWYLV